MAEIGWYAICTTLAHIMICLKGKILTDVCVEESSSKARRRRHKQLRDMLVIGAKLKKA